MNCYCWFSAEPHPGTTLSSSGLDYCRVRDTVSASIYQHRATPPACDLTELSWADLVRMSWEATRPPPPDSPFPGEFFLTRAGEIEVVRWGTWVVPHNFNQTQMTKRQRRGIIALSQQSVLLNNKDTAYFINTVVFESFIYYKVSCYCTLNIQTTIQNF